MVLRVILSRYGWCRYAEPPANIQHPFPGAFNLLAQRPPTTLGPGFVLLRSHLAQRGEQMEEHESED